MGKYTIQDKIIEFTEGEERFADIYNNLIMSLIEVETEYKEKYKSYKKIIKVLSQYSKDVDDAINKIVKRLHSKLKDNEVTGISLEDYNNLYVKDVRVNNKPNVDDDNDFFILDEIEESYTDMALLEVFHKYKAITFKHAKNVMDRFEKAESKDGVIGQNLSASAGIVGIGLSAINSKVEFSKLYDNNDTFYILKTGLERAIKSVYEQYIECLRHYNSNNYVEDKFNIDKSEELFTQFKNTESSKKKVDLAVSSLKYNPFRVEIYKYLIDNYKDENNQIELMSEKFVVDWSANKYKLEKVNNKFKQLNFYEEDQLKIEKDEVIILCESYSIDNESYLKSISLILDYHDTIYRTIDGIVYDNRSDADIALQEAEDFCNKTQNIDINDEVKLNEIKDHICKNFISRSKEKYINFIDNLLIDFDRRIRTVKGQLYEKRDLAQEARTEVIEIEKIIDNSNSNNYEDIEKVCRFIESECKSNTSKLYLEKYNECVNVWKEAEAFYFTSNNKVFDKRIDLGYSIYEGLMLQAKCEVLGIVNEQFSSLLDHKIRSIKTVKEKNYESIPDANKVYYKILANARNYEKNVINKTSDQKPLFLKITSGIKSTVAKLYEPDYNYLTCNRTKNLPNDLEEDGISLNELDKLKRIEIADNKNKIYDKYKWLSYSIELEHGNISGSDIVSLRASLSKSTINNIIKENCSIDLDK